MLNFTGHTKYDFQEGIGASTWMKLHRNARLPTPAGDFNGFYVWQSFLLIHLIKIVLYSDFQKRTKFYSDSSPQADIWFWATFTLKIQTISPPHQKWLLPLQM